MIISTICGKKGYKMKQLIISIAIGCLIATGFSQSPVNNDKKDSAPKYGLKMKPVQVKRNYREKMQQSVEKQRIKSFDFQSRTKAVVREMDNPNTKVKNSLTATQKTKQQVPENSSITFRKGSGKIYNHTKSRKRLNRVEGFVPREEMKKIDGHPPVNKDILRQALSNRKPIKARSINTK